MIKIDTPKSMTDYVKDYYSIQVIVMWIPTIMRFN